jgi:hypothetical protein
MGANRLAKVTVTWRSDAFVRMMEATKTEAKEDASLTPKTTDQSLLSSGLAGTAFGPRVSRADVKVTPLD